MKNWKIGLIGALLTGVLPLSLVGIQTAGAATLTVTRKNDPAPDGCRRNDCSLREAVIAANNRPGPDTIKLPRGRYELTRPAPDEDNAQTGDLDIERNVTIDGAGRGKTIIDGNGNDRIFHTYTSGDVKFSDLAIKGGSVIVDEAQELGGGGILNLGKMKLANVLIENNKVRVNGAGGGILSPEGRLTISNSRITGNRAPGEGIGAGIANNAGGRLTLRNSRVDHNKADGAFGGGLYVSGSTAFIEGSKFDHNRLPSACCGGGVYVGDSSILEMVKSSIRSNFVDGCCGSGLMADDSEVLVRRSVIKGNLVEGCCGGGVMAQSNAMIVLRDTLLARNRAKGCCAGGLIIQSGSDAKLVNSRVIRNRVPDGCCGGGLVNQGGGRLALIRTLVRGNQSPAGGGGGILMQSSLSELVMKGSTVAGNSTSGDGGGIQMDGSSFGAITNSTISGNTSGDEGGGILEGTTGVLTLTHVTITKNDAASGGGGILTDGGTWSFIRSIVGNNEPDDCNAILSGPTGKNLDKDSSCFGNAGAIHAGPRLRPLADYGGETPTHLPKMSSPAVDAVGRSVCPPPARDQRGVRRPQNGDGDPGRKCDLGSVERKP